MRVDTKASSISFVYPFLFASEEFDARVEALRRATWPGRGDRPPVNVWQPMQFDAVDLLPHVADFLNPPAGEADHATARVWHMDRNVLRSRLGGDAASPGAQWTLHARHDEIPFVIEAAQVALFRVGVGFLSVCAMPTSAIDDAGKWLDFLHSFRFMEGQRDIRVQAHRRVYVPVDRVAVDPQNQAPSPQSSPSQPQAQLAAYFPEPAGGLQKHPEGVGTFGEVVRAILQTGAVQIEKERDTQKHWWREVFVRGQLLPFASIYVDEIPEEQIPLLLYRVRNFFHSKQGENAAREDLRLDNPALLPYAENMWFVFSLDGGAFVACDAPSGNTPAGQFFRSTMSDHLDRQYFLLFVLTLHQRFTLMMMSADVAQFSSPFIDEYERKLAFDRIRETLRWFTARGYFAQVMQQEHHHRCYRQWQETFQVAQLYREVSDEVHDIHDWLQEQLSQRLANLARTQQEKADHLEKSLSRIAWFVVPPSLALTFLQTLGDQPFWVSAVVGIVSLISGMVAFWIVNGLLHRRKDAKVEHNMGED